MSKIENGDIENGDIDNAKVSTIRNYLEAVGGSMAIEYVIGDQRVQVARLSARPRGDAVA